MKYSFHVEGMTCEHCEKAVVRAVRQLDNNAQVVADRLQKKVEVESTASAQDISQAIVEEGYQVVA
ncbi:heavy-metal-associated domain-containing protein [Rhodoferax sp. BLA1]|uniref:heavy-metal-associated domain-containing protein n=1 Tax=Rhodoferax sp. BLA1 TaxID=2576062 RepID=UPI0015D1DF66|nr:heavy-metal-associated domain-containing protein [Rhodoferax sp. BLA1]